MNHTDEDMDDFTLPQRPRRSAVVDVRSTRDDMDDLSASSEREFTLSTGTVLALFFGLALVCAVFFGFGYSMGKKSAATALSATAASTESSDTASTAGSDTSENKPSAATPSVQAVPAYQGQAANADSTSQTSKPVTTASRSDKDATAVTLPMNNGAPAKPRPSASTDDPDGKIVEAPEPAAAAKPSAVSTALPATSAGGTVYVQVAAVSHKEDADVLLSALRRRGYTVFTRGSDSDKLIHVQLGPFATKKDADAVRQRLLGDGYNAIVK